MIDYIWKNLEKKKDISKLKLFGWVELNKSLHLIKNVNTFP